VAALWAREEDVADEALAACEGGNAVAIGGDIPVAKPADVSPGVLADSLAAVSDDPPRDMAAEMGVEAASGMEMRPGLGAASGVDAALGVEALPGV
jgi:hypothetical protein